MRIRAAMLVALMVVVGCGRMALSDDDRQKNLRRLMELSADFFEMNRYVEARAELDKLLAENPSDEEAKALMDAFGARLLNRMHGFMEKGRTMGDGPLELLKRAQRFEQKQLLDPAKIGEIVENSVHNPEKNPENLIAISRLGVHAVPELVKYLRNRQDDLGRTNSEFILIQLGTQSVPPLCAVLAEEKDTLLLQQVCRILKNILPHDSRALPALKRLYENTGMLPPVRESAKDALETISGQSVNGLPTAAEYYLAEANRYYMGGDDVDSEVDSMLKMFWVWNTTVGLRSITVPDFAMADVLAEELSYQGMMLTEDKTRFQTLISSILLQQAATNNMLASIVDYQQERFPDVEELQQEVREWEARLGRLEDQNGFAVGYRNENIAWSIGLDGLCGVLEKALVDHKDAVAVSAMQGIQAIGGENGWSVLAGWKRPVGVISVADVKDAAAGSSVSAAVNPLISALNSPIPQLRIIAANCLVRIGLPTNSPEYAKLLPVLLEGVQQQKEVITMLVSGNAQLRESTAKMLTSRGVLSMTAPGGREGVAMAVQYPPKDAILLDEAVDEFSQLHNRLALREFVADASLPLTIITVRERVEAITNQFMKKENNKLVESPLWSVTVMNDVDPDDTKVFQNLKMIKRFASEKQPVVLMTCPEREKRINMKQRLLLVSEQEARPERLSQLAQLRGNKAVTDIYGIRATFSNVFLDEELSGYDVMKTVTEMRQDPRTREVPIAILAVSSRIEELKKDLKEFLANDADVRLLDVKAGVDDLMAAIKDMKNKNPMAKRNYMRHESDLLAIDSAEAMAMLDVNVVGELSLQQAEALMASVSEKTSGLRPLALRTGVAEVLGKFGVSRSCNILAGVFKSAPKEQAELRAACMDALGACDTKGEFRALMEEALAETGYAGFDKVQQAATRSLALLSAKSSAERTSVMKDLRPNDPDKLLEPVDASATASVISSESTESSTAVGSSTSSSSDEDVESSDKKEEKKDDGEEDKKEEKKEDDGGWDF